MNRGLAGGPPRSRPGQSGATATTFLSFGPTSSVTPSSLAILRSRPKRPRLRDLELQVRGDPDETSAHVVVDVANRRKSAANLDRGGGCVSAIGLKPIVSAISGREFSVLGTVRPRVQIPGPRPFLYSNRRFPSLSGVNGTQPDHNFLRSNQTEAAQTALLWAM